LYINGVVQQAKDEVEKYDPQMGDVCQNGLRLPAVRWFN